MSITGRSARTEQDPPELVGRTSYGKVATGRGSNRVVQSSWTKRVMLAAGAAATALGGVVLVGWHIHSIVLIQVLPTVAPMQRMTALGFILSGIALVFAAMGRRRVAAVYAAFVFLEAIVVSLEYALNTRFGIDELLGRGYVMVHVSHPGRMSPITDLCFLGSSLAILTAVTRRLARFASPIMGILASVLLAVGIVGLLGYILGRTEAYGWSHFNRMALHTSAGFALLGGGLLAWAWRESETREGAPDWLPLSIGLGLAAGALGIWQAILARDAAHPGVLSGVVLACGFLGALVVAVAVAQTQRAYKRSRELQASGAMLQQLFNTTPDALLILDRRGTILRFNRQAESIFGCAPHELRGVPVEQFFPAGLHEQHGNHEAGPTATLRPEPSEHGRELYARRNDGSQFPVEVALIPVESADRTPVIVAAVRDITERRRAEEALRLSEERFRSAFEKGPIGVTLLGLDYRMIKANPELCRMFGYSEEELARMTPLEITHPADLKASMNLVEHLFTDDPDDASIRKLEKRYIKKDGQTMWASLSVGVIRDREGHPLYAISMVEDITERKRVEEELRLGNEIIANMEGGLCLVRASDGIIVHTNPSFEKMFGYSPGEIAGQHVATINAPAEKQPEEVAQEIMAELTRHGTWRGEVGCAT